MRETRKLRLERDKAIAQAEFWKNSYDIQHNTRHRMEDEIVRLRAKAGEMETLWTVAARQRDEALADVKRLQAKVDSQKAALRNDEWIPRAEWIKALDAFTQADADLQVALAERDEARAEAYERTEELHDACEQLRQRDFQIEEYRGRLSKAEGEVNRLREEIKARSLSERQLARYRNELQAEIERLREAADHWRNFTARIKQEAEKDTERPT